MNRLLPRLLVAVALFVALCALCLPHYDPPLANPFAVDLVLDPAPAGQSDPIVVSGRALYGDFLIVRHVDPTHVVFGYDSWGHAGSLSPTPVAVTPGRPLHLVLELPALNQVAAHFAEPPGRIRVTCDGVVVFDLVGHYFVRQSREFHFGENPLGGTACGPHLHGRLLAPDGRELRGDPSRFFTGKARLVHWLLHCRQVYALVLLCGAIAVGWIPLAWFRPTTLRAVLAGLQPHRWFAATLAISAMIFGWMVTDGTFDFTYIEEFGSFYDHQAASLLKGHWDVPDEAIGGEAFVFGGKLYGYFGPTPALLRLPFVLFEFAFGGLTRPFMLVYFMAALVASYLLLRQAFRLLGRPRPPPAWAVVLFVGHAGLGSTLFFLGSRAYVYHEAIMCGIVFALFTGYFALRHLAEPGRRWGLSALLCGLLSLHARPPTGLFALTLLGCVSATLLWRSLRRRDFSTARAPLLLGLLCVAAVLTFNGLSYLKFKTFDGAPLRYSRPYDAARLARIDGKSFHAANVPYGFYTYVVRPNFRLEPGFPWVYLAAKEPGRAFPLAKIDLADHALALPFSMPGLFLLATLGNVAALLVFPSSRGALLITWIAVVPMSLALFAAIATAQRYTGDWVPFLVCAGAVGLAALDSAPRVVRALFGSVLALATVAAVWLTFALTLHYQREVVWGVPEDARQSYQHLRQRIDAGLGLAPRAP